MQLGIELERERERAGMTQAQAGAALGCKQPKINKIEDGSIAISTRELQKLLSVYETPEERRGHILFRAAQASAGPSAGARANREYLKLLSLEREAIEVQAFHCARFPNLLQSEHYMLTQYGKAGQLDDPSSILQARQERKELFTIDRPPRYRVVLGMPAFDYLPGGGPPQLLVDQINYLITMSATYPDHLFIQLLPRQADLPFLPHDHVVLRFKDPKKDQVYIEYGAGESRIYAGRKQVNSHLGYWQSVHEAALSVEDSQKRLHELLDEARAGKTEGL